MNSCAPYSYIGAGSHRLTCAKGYLRKPTAAPSPPVMSPCVTNAVTFRKRSLRFRDAYKHSLSPLRRTHHSYYIPIYTTHNYYSITMFGSRRARAPATGMGGGYGVASSAPPRRKGFGLGGGRRGAAAGGYGAEPMGVGHGMTGGTGRGTGVTGGMGRAPAGGRVPRVRTRDRIKQLLGFGRSRRGATRTVMY
ncbi:hypothetical protein RSAG8_00223, partial [Rhizoctonia solani AG-8 WAC10335]